MPYTGPGPAVIGEREYARLLAEEERTAGGRVGSALLGPAVEDPIFEPKHADPVAEKIVVEPFTTLHVMKALKLIEATIPDDRELLTRWLAEEQGRAGSGPRPTVLAALRAKLA